MLHVIMRYEDEWKSEQIYFHWLCDYLRTLLLVYGAPHCYININGALSWLLTSTKSIFTWSTEEHRTSLYLWSGLFES